MRKRLAVFASFSGAGGVEHMLMNLLREFAECDLDIDLLTIRAESEHLREIPAGVDWRPLKARHSLTAIPELARYLRRQRPDALLAAKDRAGRAAVLARALSGVQTHLAIRLGTNLSAALRERSPLHRWLRVLPMPTIYHRADQVIAISDGVAKDIRQICGLPAERVRVIRNPVLTARMMRLAEAGPPHPWLAAGHATAVVMGAGRLTRQKDFTTLLRAFALLRKGQNARLIILGEGKERAALHALAGTLGITGDLLMPGFQDNPYAWIGNADLFVLSSRWEGSGNVLTEAMGLNRPVVATDCPSGPAEMLQDGRIAPLVPVGDHQRMAEAMRQQLQAGGAGDHLREAVREYRADISARNYLDALGLSGVRGQPDL